MKKGKESQVPETHEQLVSDLTGCGHIACTLLSVQQQRGIKATSK